MNKHKTTVVDGRGLPCPQPLMLTKKAVDASSSGLIEVIVDNEAGRENIIKYANHSGVTITGITEEEGAIHLTLDAGTGTPAPESHAPGYQPVKREKNGGGKVIFIRTDTIGTANRELGELLIRGFLYSLTELDVKPAAVILMNDGVLLAVQGSESVEHIAALVKSGVRVLVCGTCLDYLHRTKDLAAGTISNMYDITEALMEASDVLTV